MGMIFRKILPRLEQSFHNFHEIRLEKSLPIDGQDLIQRNGESLEKAVIDRLANGRIGLYGEQADLTIKNFDHIKNTLMSLLDNPRFTRQAVELLVALGDEQTLDEIISKINAYLKQKDSVLYRDYEIENFICNSLASPGSEEQWDFMRQCPPWLGFRCFPIAASNDSRSLEMLKTFQKKSWNYYDSRIKSMEDNPKEFSVYRNVDEIKAEQKKSSDYFDSLVSFKINNPGGFLPNKDIDIAIRNVYPAFLDEKEQKAASFQIKYNNQQNVAIVNLTVYFGPDWAYGYNLVFTKTGDLWVVKAIWRQNWGT